MNENNCVLACVTVQKGCAELIRRGRALAQEMDVPLRVLHVSQAKNILGSPDSAAILNELFSLALEADAEMNILYEENVAAAIARYARECVDRLPLNARDHLCCGNASIVEYYLSTGDADAAGKVLGGMVERRRKEGEYRYLAYQYHNGLTPSLFYGISGIGYELLRYACPDRILPLL